MSAPLYRAAGPVTLVGGGPVTPAQLAAALALAPEVVAADSGGDVVLPDGRRFGAVIGDLDSVRSGGALEAAGVPVHRISEQDSTDLEKCLRSVAAPMLLGLGFLGGRIDHHLAAMNALVKFQSQRVVLIGGVDLCFLCPRDFVIDLEAGTRVSLFPMAPVSGLRSEGLRWSVEGLAMAPDGLIGTSNEARGGPVRLGFDRAAMLVILPVALLGPVVSALGGEAGR